MAGRRSRPKKDEVEERKVPNAAERKNMRAHDERGNVRPADGRWDLHKPEQESKYVKGEPNG